MTRRQALFFQYIIIGMILSHHIYIALLVINNLYIRLFFFLFSQYSSKSKIIQISTIMGITSSKLNSHVTPNTFDTTDDFKFLK